MAPAGPWLLVAAAVFAIAFAVWQRRTAHAIVPAGLLGARPAWGSLVVSFLVGAALIAALVDVPVFARTTQGGGQLAAALVLLRFLIALPVGAVVGGWLTRRYGLGLITGVGLALAGAMFVLMAFWERDALKHAPATSCCCSAASASVSPCPRSTRRCSAPPARTATVSSARWSWSPGWSACSSASPRSPRSVCAATTRWWTTYRRRTSSARPHPAPAARSSTRSGEAAISQVHTIFAGAAVCAFAAAVLAVLLLGRRPVATE